MSIFDAIKFDRESHTYRCGDIPLTSVTTVIGELKPKFDRDGVSKAVAERDGITQEEVLADWEQKSLAALAKGSTLHAYIEDLLQGRIDSVVESMNDMPETLGFKRAWGRLVESHKARMLRQELKVGDIELGVAGTVDAIVGLTQKNLVQTCHVFDWKSGKKFNANNPYEKLLPPFDDVDNCHLSMYSLQTSIYRLILERHAPRVIFGDSYLVHLRSDGSHCVYRGRDYRERCKAWLLARAAKLRAAA